MMTVSDAYLLGIREGRSALNAALADGIDKRDFCRASLANVERCLKQGLGDVMREQFKGQRDFYRNQIKEA